MPGSYRTQRRRRQRERSKSRRWCPRRYPHDPDLFATMDEAARRRILPSIIDTFFADAPLMAYLSKR